MSCCDGHHCYLTKEDRVKQKDYLLDKINTQNDIDAMISLGDMFIRFHYEMNNPYENAIKYYTMAGMQNTKRSATAFQKMGNVYLNLLNDIEKTKECYEKAKQLCKANSDFNNPEDLLGYAILLDDINRYDSASMELYHKLILCNKPEILSQVYHNLGYKYKNGLGCDTDLPLSLMHYSKAGKLGNEDSINNLRLLIEHIIATEKNHFTTFSETFKFLGDEIVILLDCILISTNRETFGTILINNLGILKQHENAILNHDYFIFKHMKPSLTTIDYKYFILKQE